MTVGALMIARNNTEIDYVKQAVFNGYQIKRYLGIPVSLITDNVDYLHDRFTEHPFDQIIEIQNTKDYGYKKYNDGTYSRRNLEFKNTTRARAYELSPYDETLLLDTDYIIANDLLKNCFNQLHDFLIYKDGIELSNWRDISEFRTISSKGIDFYWATVVFFRKTPENKVFFSLLHHISENYDHYRTIFQITSPLFRNDYVFSIAIHIMNGYTNGDFAKPLPGKLFYTTDRDLLLRVNLDDFLFLIEKEKSYGNYMPLRMKGSSVHVMNKFSINRTIYVPQMRDT